MNVYEMIKHSSSDVEFYIISITNPELTELDNIVDTAENIRCIYRITDLLKKAEIEDFQITKKLVTIWAK